MMKVAFALLMGLVAGCATTATQTNPDVGNSDTSTGDTNTTIEVEL